MRLDDEEEDDEPADHHEIEVLGGGARDRDADRGQAEFEDGRKRRDEGGPHERADQRAEPPDDHHEEDEEALANVEDIPGLRAPEPQKDEERTGNAGIEGRHGEG